MLLIELKTMYNFTKKLISQTKTSFLSRERSLKVEPRSFILGLSVLRLLRVVISQCYTELNLLTKTHKGKSTNKLAD